ncbi:molybdopterin molybdotransferase MoeA [Mesorhizobium koreense]|uniref:molybdopterin molybdotransferase MoeA n=1 Tax=Mesorhizobium koreense TaxID=3074855 RepID=UPI00287B8653|nr:gephyrin-like molybdotransferase Glp [Mesorhizobium sp. WR6]
MNTGDLLPVDSALELLLAGAAPLAKENVPIGEAAGRVLTEPLAALRTQPPFNASAMDGYAVRTEDIAALPARLKIIGAAQAGKRYPGTVGKGETVRIFTGAPVPDGADAVLLQEDARIVSEGLVEALESVARGRHIRRAGLDFAEGEPLLPAGRVLDPAALSLAAAANHAEVPVVRRPLVAIAATGDELLLPGSHPGPDQIIASNGYGVAAIARDAGAEILDLGIVPDDRKLIAAALRRALAAGAHILVTLGGASVGDHDLVREVLTAEGMTLDFWKIAMRPGKPLMSGRIGQTRVLGLPGNPVSSMVGSHLFLVPLIARLAGRTHRPDVREARLAEAMPENDRRRDYVRAAAEETSEGLLAAPFGIQDSSMLRTLAAANCLIIREPHAPAAAAGDPCRVLFIR